MANELTVIQERVNSVRDFLSTDDFKKQLTVALPKHLTVDKLLRVALTVIRLNPRLLDCSQESLMSSLMGAAQLGLSFEPELGQAYLVPYWNGNLKKFEAKLIPGYRGYITLARNSGKVQVIQSQPVYAKDEFDIEYGRHRRLRHVPYEPTNAEVDEIVKNCKGDFTQLDQLKGGLRGAYVWVDYVDGTDSMEYMPYVDILRVMLRSKSKDNGPWQTDLGKMARKSVIRSHFKLVPLSVEMTRAVAMEEAAEIGESQTDMILGSIDAPSTYAIPGVSPALELNEAEPEPNGYEQMRIKYVNPSQFEAFDKFMVETAARYKLTAEALQVQACKNFAKVLLEFEKWQHPKAKPADAPQVRRATQEAVVEGEAVKTAGITTETLQAVIARVNAWGPKGSDVVNAYLKGELNLSRPELKYLREEEGQELLRRLEALNELSPRNESKMLGEFYARCEAGGMLEAQVEQWFARQKAETAEQQEVIIVEAFPSDEVFEAWVKSQTKGGNGNAEA